MVEVSFTTSLKYFSMTEYKKKEEAKLGRNKAQKFNYLHNSGLHF